MKIDQTAGARQTGDDGGEGGHGAAGPYARAVRPLRRLAPGPERLAAAVAAVAGAFARDQAKGGPQAGDGPQAGEADVAVLLLGELDRRPFPRVAHVAAAGPRIAELPASPIAQVQAERDAPGELRGRLLELVEAGDDDRVLLAGLDFPGAAWWRGPLRDAGGWHDAGAICRRRGRAGAVLVAVLRRDGQPPLAQADRGRLRQMAQALDPLVCDAAFAAPAGPDAVGRVLADLPLACVRVLHHLLQGRSEKEAAAGLGRSVHTVHSHVRRLYADFGVESRAELMALFVDPDLARRVADHLAEADEAAR